MNLHSHNWPKIITRLEAVRCAEYPCGVSDSEIARQLNVTRSAVFKWKFKDVEPSHYNGERLIAMEKKYCNVADSSPQTGTSVA